MKSDCLPGDGVFLTDLISAPPAINLKPVSGGVEIAVRYITRATERYEMRSRLYQAAMNLIRKKGSQDSLNVVKVVQP
jgi:hypothetical protein